MSVKLLIHAELPDGLARELLQHILDFDVKHKGCIFRIKGSAPDASTDEVVEMMQLDPSFDFFAVRKKH